MSKSIVLTFVVAVAVSVAAFFGGRALHGQPARASNAFDATAPGYNPVQLELGETAGGFTGIGAAGVLQGDPLYSGPVSAVDAESITIDAAAGPTTLTLSGTDKLLRLSSLTRPLAVGNRVIAHVDPATGEVVSILLVAE